MDLKLKDKVVLVTGGTGGIGTAIVKAFLGEGSKVAFSSTSQAKIDALIPTLGAAEGQVAGFVADMNKEEDIKNLVESTKNHFGTIDVVIPNAGYEGQALPALVRSVRRRFVSASSCMARLFISSFVGFIKVSLIWRFWI